MSRERHQYRVLLTREQIAALPVRERALRAEVRLTEKGERYVREYSQQQERQA